jgi:aspartate/methionine/tyrosine aminotransferase
MKLAERMSRLGTETAFEVLARAKALEAEGRDIVHLEIGEPDYDTPQYIKDAACKALADGHTGYGPSAGIMEARERFAAYLAETRGMEVSADEVVITPGAKPILFFGILALVDEGDEVICPNPGYPIYESVVEFVGATAVAARLREENEFRLDPEELKSLITDKTKMIVLNSPHNPTGSVLTKEDLEAIAELAIANDIWVLSDEPYSKMIFEGEHYSIAAVPGMKERTILLEGFSKTYAMTGWRLGYAAMPVELVEHVAKLQTNCTSCTAAFTQYAGIAALDGPQEESEAMMASFKTRRDIIVDGLNDIPGISCLSPAGAFYVFPNVTELDDPCDVLAKRCLEEAGVAVLSGTAFGKYGEGYLRLSSANSVENINEALARIANMLSS